MQNIVVYSNIIRIFALNININIKTHTIMEYLKNELWHMKGYDMDFLDALTDKELISLHDTEFFYGD